MAMVTCRMMLSSEFTPPLSLALSKPHGIDEEGLLAMVENTRFDRGGLHGSGVVGLKPFFTGRTPSSFEALYSPQELEELKKLQSTERDVEARMVVKITDHYLHLALQSENLMNLIKARPNETLDLSGSIDPSNQNKFSPAPGLLHKYEMVLLFVARTCSAHCRYCYRFDLFTNKSGKMIISSKDAANYIKHYNSLPVGLRKYPHFPVSEALLSGGDPMILPNTALAEYIIDLAEAGVKTIRIGTKELSFFPYRFDTNFFDMLDLIHAAYPEVRLVFSLHFTHPAEFLMMKGGNYIEIDGEKGPGTNGGIRAMVNADNGIGPNADNGFMAEIAANSIAHGGSVNKCNAFTVNDNGGVTNTDRITCNYKWLEATERPIMELNKRGHYISLRNQTPIIRKVNDNSEELAILQKEMFRKGIENHYIFQCRDIQGKREFAVPVEESWSLFTNSQRGLSGMEKQARFVMSTEKGKVEVVGFFDDKVVFRLHRSSFETNNQSIIICKSNPNALWIDDYRDHVVFDPFQVIC